MTNWMYELEVTFMPLSEMTKESLLSFAGLFS